LRYQFGHDRLRRPDPYHRRCQDVYDPLCAELDRHLAGTVRSDSQRNDGVTRQPPVPAEQALRPPRAAAIAGIIFAVLFAISIGLMRLAIPEGLEAINLSLWVIMVFPAWVFAISLYILIESLRGKAQAADAALGAGE
jgi:hypothetical protein